MGNLRPSGCMCFFTTARLLMEWLVNHHLDCIDYSLDNSDMDKNQNKTDKGKKLPHSQMLHSEQHYRKACSSFSPPFVNFPLIFSKRKCFEITQWSSGMNPLFDNLVAWHPPAQYHLAKQSTH